MTKRAAIYARVSVARDENEDADSIARQIKACRAFLATKDPAWIEAGVFEDKGVSAFTGKDRPGWLDLRAAVEAKEVDAVVVFAISRAARNTERLLEFVRLCKERGVHFESVSEPIGGTYGKVFLTILAALAELESEMKSARAKLKYAQMKKDGLWHGGFRTWGYRVEYGTPDGATKDARLAVDPHEAEVIREVVRRVKAGESLRSVTRWLADSGELTTQGNRWNQTHLRKYLIHGAPGIISAKDRRAVEAVLTADTYRDAKGRQRERTPRPARGRYLLTGLLTCGRCDGNLTGRPRYKRGKPGKPWVAVGRTYVCNRGFDGVHLTIEAEALEEAVVAAARNRRIAEEAAPVEDPAAPLVAERDRIEAEMEAIGDSDLPDAVIRGRARKLARELRRVEEELSAVEAPRGSWATLYADALSDTRSTAAYLDDPSTRSWLETLLTDIRIAAAAERQDFLSRISIQWRPEAVEFPAESAS